MLVTGRAVEYNGLTELSPVIAVDVCVTGTVAPAPYDLPRADGVTFERNENTLVTFPERLTATEHYQLGRYGEVTVSADGRLFQPTDRNGVTQAANDRHRLLVDDGSTRQNPATVPYTSPEALRLGDTVRRSSSAAGSSARPSASCRRRGATATCSTGRPVNSTTCSPAGCCRSSSPGRRSGTSTATSR
ncbi:hypothetical protein GCM10009780_71330 [Actinomadura alba]